MRWTRLFLILFFGLPCGRSFAADEIASGRLRAYFVLPVAHSLTMESCWIEIAATSPGRAERIVDRIRGTDLKLRGGVRVVPDASGAMAFVYRPDPDGPEIIVARAVYEGGWYRRAELCGGAESPDPNCRYVFERDLDNQALSLRLLIRK